MSKPTLRAYTVKDRADAPAIWKQIGACFDNRGGGYTLVLDALPIGNRIILMPPLEEQRGAAPSDTFEGEV